MVKKPKGEYFDLSGQVLSKTPAKIMVVAEKNGNLHTLVLYDSMFGIGLLVTGIYVELGKLNKAEVWANNQPVESVVLAGNNLSGTGDKMLYLDDVKTITIIRVEDSVVQEMTESASYVLGARNAKLFPDYTKVEPPSNAKEYGEMTGDDLLKYLSFFPDKVYAWNHATGEIEEVVNGDRTLKNYAKLRDEVPIYIIHDMYMSRLNEMCSKSIEEIARGINPKYFIDKSAIPNYKLPEILDIAPRDEDGVNRNTNNELANKFISLLKDEKIALDDEMLTKEDVLMWLQFRDFMARDLMPGISKNYADTVKGKHSITKALKSKTRPDWLWTKNVLDWMAELIDRISDTGLLSNSKERYEQASEFADDIIEQ